MRYAVATSFVQYIGEIWQPGVEVCAQCKTLTPYDVENLRAVGTGEKPGNCPVTREAVEMWLSKNAGDFSSITDFSASLEIDGETVDIPWTDEDSEFTYNVCMFDDEN